MGGRIGIESKCLKGKYNSMKDPFHYLLKKNANSSMKISTELSLYMQSKENKDKTTNIPFILSLEAMVKAAHVHPRETGHNSHYSSI